MVERHLAKVVIAGSSPVERSIFHHTTTMQVSQKLYTAHVHWEVLKSDQIENFIDRAQLIRFVGFFDNHPKYDGQPMFTMKVFESDMHYFTAAEQWHVSGPKEMDMNLLREEARAASKPPIVPDDTLELKPGEDITK